MLRHDRKFIDGPMIRVTVDTTIETQLALAAVTGDVIILDMPFSC